ncbi:MAG TPA: hypothetical protein VGA99_04635 [bacterium]
MSTAIFLPLAVVFATAVFALVWVMVRTVARFQGKMLVTCPETDEAVGVEVDVKNAALRAAVGDRALHLKSCTRWPERQNCGQECLHQIELGPENCLVRTLVAEWYRGKTCLLCNRPFDEIHWHDHKPALMRMSDKHTFAWPEIAVEKLPEILNTYKPVCWNCHVVETFRRERPELVVERPWRRGHLV